MPSVLLLELAAIDRFHRAISFPFLRGHLVANGLTCAWLRFAVPARARALHDEDAFALDERDTRVVLDVLRERGLTHVLCSVEPSARLYAALSSVVSARSVGYLGSHGESAGRIEGPVPVAEGALDAFLGIASPSSAPAGSLFETAVPDFAFEPGNEAARTALSLPFLVCGDECSYRRPATASAHFRDLELPEEARAGGCTFCVRPPTRSAFATAPEVLMRRQLDALARTHPAWSGRLSIRAVGEPFLKNVEALSAILRELPLGPCDVILDGRADVLNALRPRLERALSLLEGSGHMLHVGLVGIESFADEELERMNKGTSARTNLELVQNLFELEHAHPATFAFQRHGGLSVVLFTPWTRLEDLALNVAIIRNCRLEEVCGKTLTSRLRLYPSLPLYYLARRDGLLAERYDDPRLDTARENLYANEAPWRFREPVMEAVSRLLLRLHDSAPDPTDAIGAALGARLHHASAVDRLGVAQAIVDAAIASPETTDPLALLALAEPSLRVGSSGARPPPEQGTPAREPDAPAASEPGRAGGRHERAIAPPDTRFHLLAFEAGLKPVVRVEDATQDALERLRAMAPIVVSRRPVPGGPFEVFLGRRRDEVDEAVRLTDVLRAEPEEDVWAAAVRAVGVLLGYPECCSAAFASRPAFMLVDYHWPRVAARVQVAGAVPAVLNPGVELVEHMPCSLECEASARLGLARLAAACERYGEEAARWIERRLSSPWLLLVDQEREALELEVELDPDGSLSSPIAFRAGMRKGHHALLERAREGDELRFDEHQLCVMRRGRLHVALGARGFLWWHRAPLQRELWRSMIAVRFAAGRRGLHEKPSATPATRSGAEDVEGARIAEQVRSALEARERDLPFRLQAIEPGRGRARVHLVRGAERLVLFVEARVPGRPAYALAGPFAISHAKETAIDTSDKREAVRAFVRALVPSGPDAQYSGPQVGVQPQSRRPAGKARD